jgi:PAS domain S-box-containing protein
LPYRTIENAVDGIIVTLVEINRLKSTQEELKREQDLLIRVLENSPLGTIILDEKGNFTYLNKYAENVLEITNEDLKNYKYNKLNFEIQSEDCEGLKDEDLPFQIVMKTRKPVYNIVQILNWGNGKTKVIRTNGAPIFDEHGDVKGGVFSFEEITEEYKSEHAKQRKFHQMLSILENSPVAEIMVNEEGLIIYSNPGSAKIFKEKTSNLKGTPFDDLFNDFSGKNGDKLKKNERPFSIIKEKKGKIQNLTLTCSKNGKNKKLSLWGSPLYTIDDKLENVVFTINLEKY